MAAWYKGKLDPTFITIMQLIEDELKKYGDDDRSKLTLLQDIRDTMIIYIKLEKPKSNNRWWIFWK